MGYLTSGFAEVLLPVKVNSGYRSQLTSCAFSIAGWDPTSIDDILALWATFIGAIGWPGSCVVEGPTVRVGTSDPDAPLVYTSSGTGTGSGSGAVSSNQVSMLATKTTLLGGRKGRGRMYLPAPLESQVDSTGQMDGTFVGNVQEALDDLISAIGSELGGDPYLLHAGPSPAPTLIQSITVQPVVATQRRRLDRG